MEKNLFVKKAESGEIEFDKLAELTEVSTKLEKIRDKIIRKINTYKHFTWNNGGRNGYFITNCICLGGLIFLFAGHWVFWLISSVILYAITIANHADIFNIESKLNKKYKIVSEDIEMIQDEIERALGTKTSSDQILNVVEKRKEIESKTKAKQKLSYREEKNTQEDINSLGI